MFQEGALSEEVSPSKNKESPEKKRSPLKMVSPPKEKSPPKEYSPRKQKQHLRKDESPLIAEEEASRNQTSTKKKSPRKSKGTPRKKHPSDWEESSLPGIESSASTEEEQSPFKAFPLSAGRKSPSKPKTTMKRIIGNFSIHRRYITSL